VCGRPGALGNTDRIVMKKPPIVVNRIDHTRLVQMANGLIDRNPDLADELLAELERAKVRDERAVPADSVQIGRTVEFRLDDGAPRRVTLVYPADADVGVGRISVLTPVGVAMLGLSAGQTMEMTSNDRRSHRLTIDTVVAAAE
jgi:regulator of nucleoside diphosphate kinase